MAALLFPLGFGSLRGAVLLVAAGLLVSRGRAVPLRLGTHLVIGALVLFFLSFYGDGIEIERHVMPGVMCLVLGAVTYAIGFAGVLAARVKPAPPWMEPARADAPSPRPLSDSRPPPDP